MFKYFLVFLCLSTSIASAQTIDINTLSDYEKQVHRAAWCRTLVVGLPHSTNFDKKKVLSIKVLLSSNGFFKKDTNRVYRKTVNDLKKQIILGEISFSQNDIDDCEVDMKKLLSEEYVPNFIYK